MLAAVDMGSELDPLVGHFSHLGERKDLKAAGVGQDRLVPVDELVQAAGLSYQLMAGTQKEMIGIAEQYLRADLVDIPHRHRLDRPLRADRQKGGSVDDAMRSVELADASFSFGALLCDLKPVFHNYNISMASPKEKKRYF